MNSENETEITLRNRLYGLLFLAAAGVSCWVWPPTRYVEQRRGALGLLQDMGMSDTTKYRLALYWGAVLVLVLMGGYQIVTGRRIRRPDW